MKLRMRVEQDRLNTYVGKKGQVEERILTLIDKDKHAGQIVPGSMDYTLTPEESKLIPMDALEDKIVTIGVREIQVWNNRVRVRGAFDLDDLRGYLTLPVPAVGKPAK